MTDDQVKGISTASNGAGHNVALVSTPGTGFLRGGAAQAW
jgi:hypothetical protein